MLDADTKRILPVEDRPVDFDAEWYAEHAKWQRALGLPDEEVNAAALEGLRRGFIIIMCAGETLAERLLGKTDEIVLDQVRDRLEGVTPEQAARVVVAYEPDWAIGTGATATPEEAQAVHAAIRYQALAKLFGPDVALGMRVPYGGSMNPDNVEALMAQPDIDGGLLGGASLKAETFEKVARYGRSI